MLGSQLVSTIAKIGIFNFNASATAICSRVVSTTNKAPGRRVISEIEPKFFSNLARERSTAKRSFLDNELNVPSSLERSIESIFLTAFLIVTKLVSIPPGHLSVM